MEPLTKGQINDFKEAYSLFNTDETGAVNVEELGQVMLALRQPNDKMQLLDIINEVDINGNGKIEFAEFVILMMNKAEELTKEEEMEKIFKILDIEQNKRVSARNIKYFMRKVAKINITGEETEAMLEYVSQNPDGITFDDFKEIIEMASAEKKQSQDINFDELDP